MRFDLASEEFTALFAQAPVYRKSAVVNARPAVAGERIVTTLADGTAETTVTCDGGEVVITNPGGEEYAVGAEKFAKRYAPLGGGRFQARGMIRAIPNPAGGDVTVIAPWGEEQHGGPACVLAVIYDPEKPGEIGSDRYLIGAAEFAETYAFAADVNEGRTTMTTETTTPAGRAKQISDRLLEIGPYPGSSEEATAQALARYLAVRAAVINHQQLSPDAPFSRRQVDLLTVLFAAAHALRIFAEVSETDADQTAREIWNAWEDGGGIGEWLWDHLGSAAASEIGPLADELAALARAAQPAEGLLAYADPIRRALNRAVIDAKSANHRDTFMKALRALEDASAEAEEAGQ